MELRLIFMALICLCIAQLAFAVENNYVFSIQDEEQRFVRLIKEIRCPTCPTQSLFEAVSTSAEKMRTEIYRMVNAGMSNNDIRKYVVKHYGEDILFNPPMRRGSWILWAAPFVLLSAALFYLFNKSRRLSIECFGLVR